MKRIRRWWRKHWGLTTLVSVCTIVLAWLMLYRLGSLMGGLSNGEVQQQLHSSSWHNLIGNPLYLPFTAVQWLLLSIFSHHGQTVARLPSVVFGIFSLWEFAYILRRWYGVRTTAFGTVLFLFSGWFLHSARLANFSIVFIFGILSIVVLHIMLERATRVWTVLAVLLASTVLLYIPGFLWLLILLYALQWRNLFRVWNVLGRWWIRAATIIAVLVGISLLAHALWIHHALIRPWLGLPAHFLTPLAMLHQFANIFLYLFIRGPHTPELWLAKLPIIDIFTTVMCGIGIYFYATHWQAPRTRLLAGMMLLGAILVALGGPMTESVIVPLIYVLAAAGMAYLLHEWLQVFPFNPLARTIGIVLLAGVVALVCTYNIREYYIAWPHNRLTASVFKDRTF